MRLLTLKWSPCTSLRSRWRIGVVLLYEAYRLRKNRVHNPKLETGEGSTKLSRFIIIITVRVCTMVACEDTFVMVQAKLKNSV